MGHTFYKCLHTEKYKVSIRKVMFTYLWNTICGIKQDKIPEIIYNISDQPLNLRTLPGNG